VNRLKKPAGSVVNGGYGIGNGFRSDIKDPFTPSSALVLRSAGGQKQRKEAQEGN